MSCCDICMGHIDKKIIKKRGSWQRRIFRQPADPRNNTQSFFRRADSGECSEPAPARDPHGTPAFLFLPCTKKIIKKSFCKSLTGHMDEKMLQMSCYDICMGHNKNFFSHMSQLTGKAGHNIQIFLHMSRFFIECIFIKYEKYYGQKTSMNSKYL